MIKCHMCRSSNLYKFLDLGSQPHSDGFLTKEDLSNPEPFYPLDVYICRDCGLVQLGTIVSGRVMYNEKYFYEQSTTDTGKCHYFSMSKMVCERFALPKSSLVVDIGSNVGVLLSGFKAQGMSILGVDPAPLIAKKANELGIETIADFFNPEVARKIVGMKGKAKVVTGTNIFAHLPDLHETMDSLKILLDEDGMFIIEVPYLVDLIKNVEYDTIYHQHLRYISVKPLVPFFAGHGFEIFDIEKLPIHGGSLRISVSRKGKRKISPHAQEFLDLEKKENIYSLEVLQDFAKKVAEQRRLLMELLLKLKAEGKRIVAVSTPAKGNTLLNYCGIGADILDYATEKAKIKIGLYTPGTHIPIFPDARLLEDMPDYALLLAWNFAEEIMRNNQEYLKRGGKFIIPIPKPRVVTEMEEMKIENRSPAASDKRGTIIDIMSGEIHHVSIITFTKGSVRANHYHKNQTQYTYVIRGEIELKMKDLREKNPKVTTTVMPERSFVAIPPMVIHKLTALKDSEILALTTEERTSEKYEEDTYRIEI
ncbi:MAG: methyltransferase domain-containing protein [Candidatus Woesearchaeota archaeon]